MISHRVNKIGKSDSLRKRAEKKLATKNKKSFKNFSLNNFVTLVQELSVHQVELEMQNEELQIALRKLESSQYQYLELYEFAPVGYFSLDQNNYIVSVNSAGSRLFGLPRTQLLNRPFSEFITSHFQDNFFLHCHSVFTNKTKEITELEFKRDDGTILYGYVESNIIKSAEKTNAQWRLSILDITSRKKAEENDMQNQLKFHSAAKISSLEMLASALSHDLTQPFTAINNFISGCILRLERKNFSKKALLETLKEAEQQMQRAGKLIHNMRDFVRKEKSFFEIVDINLVVEEAISFVKKEASLAEAKISTSFTDSALCLLVDKIQIQQVIANLVRNGMEAMINASTTNPELVIQVMRIRSNLVKIRFCDNGPGIDEELAKKIFEPCFTTKPQGLGMGLAICRQIIEAHGGELVLINNKKMGATFEFTLPLPQHLEAL